VRLTAAVKGHSFEEHLDHELRKDRIDDRTLAHSTMNSAEIQQVRNPTCQDGACICRLTVV